MLRISMSTTSGLNEVENEYGCRRTMYCAMWSQRRKRENANENTEESWCQYRSTIEIPYAKILQRLIRILQRKRNRRSVDVELRGEREICFAVGPGEIGDRAHRAFPPLDRIGKFRNIAHVYACADHRR